MINPTITVFPFVITFLISLVITPLTVILFSKRGWMIDPKKTPHPAHIHKEPVPKGGGLPVFVAVFLTLAIFLKGYYVTLNSSYATLPSGNTVCKTPAISFSINRITLILSG